MISTLFIKRISSSITNPFRCLSISKLCKSLTTGNWTAFSFFFFYLMLLGHFAGALFSSMAAVTSICYLTSTATFNSLYISSLGTFPGAVFLLMAAFCIVNMGLLLWVAFHIPHLKHLGSRFLLEILKFWIANERKRSRTNIYRCEIEKHQWFSVFFLK